MFNKLKNKFMANLAGHLAPFLAPKAEAPVVLEADVTHGRQTINCKGYSAMNKASLLTPEEAQNLLALSFQRTPKDFKVTLPSGASYAMDEMDGGGNLATKSMFGIDGVANAIVYTFFAKHGFIGWQLCSMLAQHWLINRACRLPNEDALAPGWQLEWQKDANGGESELSEEEKARKERLLLQAVETANQKFHVAEKALQFGVNRSIYGQALAYFEIEGDDPETPLNIDGIKPGSFKGISIVEPYWAFPDWGENSMTPGTLNFYQPEFYTIGGKRIHKSRLVTKPFVSVPDILKPSYYFGGIPLTQMIYERVYAAEKTANEVPELALTKRMLVVDANINDMIARPDAFVSKANMLWRERNNKGVFYKNPQEAVQQVDTNLADLDNNVWTQYQLVAAVSSMPADRLLGTSPKGFQSTGEYERRTYAQTLKSSYQEICYREFLEKAHALVLKSEFNVADLFLLNFNPIDTPTQAEKAQTQLTQANRDIALVNAGIISPDEARQALAADKESGYSNLPPEAPQQEMPDLDALLKDGDDEPPSSKTPQTGGKTGDGTAAAADEWKENDHPRDDDGKFAAQGAAGSKGAAAVSKLEKSAKSVHFEKADAYLKDAKPVATIEGNEFEGNTVAEKRNAAEKYFEANLRNKKFTNRDWGKDIKVLSASKALHEAFSEEKINAIKYLPDMLENAKYIGFEEDKKQRPNVKGFHYLACNVTLNKKPQGVIMSVREDNNGNIFYNHILRKSEEGTVSLPAPNVGAPVPSSMDSIAEINPKIKWHFGEDEWDESKCKRDKFGKFSLFDGGDGEARFKENSAEERDNKGELNKDWRVYSKKDGSIKNVAKEGEVAEVRGQKVKVYYKADNAELLKKISKIVPIEIEPINNREEAFKLLDIINGEDLENDDTGIVAQVNSEQRNKLTSGKAVEKSKKNGFSFSQHLGAAVKIKELYKGSLLQCRREDENHNKDILIRRMFVPISVKSEEKSGENIPAYAELTLKETKHRKRGNNHRIYSVELQSLIKRGAGSAEDMWE